MRKKVLILANSANGLFSFRKELIDELINNYDIYLALPYGESIEYFKSIGCIYIETPIDRHGTNPFKELQLIKKYQTIIQKVKPSIVLTYTIKPNIYGGIACQLENIPYIVNITGLGLAVENRGYLQEITVFLYKIGLRKAKMVFFQNSENQKFMLNHHIINGKYDLLPGSGVNLIKYEPMSYPDNETVDFLFVARIRKEKGIDQYLDAAKVIRKKYPQTRFHVCGECEEDYYNLLQELHNDGTIIYHGAVKNMKEIYQQISCTVHPSYYPEGMSNVLLESCASGRPIITTDRAGCGEIVNDGVNGLIVKQKDSQDLIDKIEWFLKLTWNERKTMGIRGREKVEREFDRNIVIKKYLTEIQILCGDK